MSSHQMNGKGIYSQFCYNVIVVFLLDVIL